MDAVCITGGEPTLQPDLPDFIANIKALGFLVKLDTNGYRPEILKAVVEQGLIDYVAMDLKNSPTRYGQTVGVERINLAPLEESLCFLLSGAVDYELRTTVVAQLHDDESVLQMGQWVADCASKKKVKRWFVQPFVDRDTVMFAGLRTPEKPEIKAFQGILANCAEQVSIRGNT